ncbi:hypothetical protein RhiirA4_539803 [Rhizophagus irregularis]|uniref:Uncharacterized protein n=1 Tax=Rhizophagus irregularis TaxID=588596 RepID=A0A2I1G4Z2_9GLOM|nr:hypothetical protein RhiirA4_539803 [Rhizophagus irregularis]
MIQIVYKNPQTRKCTSANPLKQVVTTSYHSNYGDFLRNPEISIRRISPNQEHYDKANNKISDVHRGHWEEILEEWRKYLQMGYLEVWGYSRIKKKVGVKQHTSYLFEEKLVVVKYAQKNGRNATAKHFNLNAPMIGKWIKQSSSWEENKKKKRAGTPEKKAFYPEAEKVLYNWIVKQRKKRFAINYISMRLQICKILKESAIQTLYLAGERTKISQKLPEDIEQKLDEF